jgi:hypothetical protein
MRMYADRMRLPQEEAPYFDRKSFDQLHFTSQAAVDILLPAGVKLVWGYDFEDTLRRLPARLHLLLLPNTTAHRTISAHEVERLDLLAQSILSAFPLYRFKGTTSCGRVDKKMLHRDPKQSSHEFIEAICRARSLFGAKSKLLQNAMPPNGDRFIKEI